MTLPSVNPFETEEFKKHFKERLDHLRSFASVRELKSSTWFRQEGPRLEEWLRRPYVENGLCLDAERKRWIRFVSWNIEKGRRLEGLRRAFRTDARLAAADVVMLQEADVGMARSGNQFVARELARALSFNFAFAPAYIELTKGVGDDLASPGDNLTGMQGNAILSRFPITAAHTLCLPQCFEPFERAEKRYGYRNALRCELEYGERAITVVCTHLEVRNTPRCRAQQVRALLQSLPMEKGRPVVVAGDFNCNTFARGTAWRTLVSFLRLIRTAPDDLVQATLHPPEREALFDLFRRNGFEWDRFNASVPTASTRFRTLEDVRFVPSLMMKAVLRSLERFGSALPLHLDWFMARNVEPAEVRQSEGALGLRPGTPQTLTLIDPDVPAEELSDHRPIVVDVVAADQAGE